MKNGCHASLESHSNFPSPSCGPLPQWEYDRARTADVASNARMPPAVWTDHRSDMAKTTEKPAGTWADRERLSPSSQQCDVAGSSVVHLRWRPPPSLMSLPAFRRPAADGRPKSKVRLLVEPFFFRCVLHTGSLHGRRMRAPLDRPDAGGETVFLIGAWEGERTGADGPPRFAASTGLPPAGQWRLPETASSYAALSASGSE